MKTLLFDSYQSALIDAMRKDEMEIRDIRLRKSLVHQEFIESLPFREGDLVEIACRNVVTGEVLINTGVISWISINEINKDVTGLFYPLNKDGKPSKKLKHLDGNIIAVNIIRKGRQNGNA